jgi:hypothetical protein
LGDLDGDGVVDLVVGASGGDGGGLNRGAVHVLFMHSNGTVKSSAKIDNTTVGGPALTNGGLFGRSVAPIGDLDGDGVADLAVGAYLYNSASGSRGSVHVLFLNTDGTPKSTVRITQGQNGGPTLAASDFFGRSVASLGDLDGDGITELAVGAHGDDTGGSTRGAVYVLFMRSNGTVQNLAKIGSGLGGGPTLVNFDQFGKSVAPLGDVDGDGVVDLAVGAEDDDTGGNARGAIHVLLLNANGTVKSSSRIAHDLNGGPSLATSDFFGGSVAPLGDLDGDGLADLAVGAFGDETGGSDRGAVYVLFLAPPGADYGDAPDTSPATAAGNYQTIAANAGASHTVIGGIFLGNSVDVDSGLLQNADADADDVEGVLPDDEDGVLSPLDLLGTEGAAPTVTLLVTNTSGASATLSGWIDYNADGVFDNATERAQTTIGTGTTDVRVTLVFPTIPDGSAGKTYARFRFSSDAAAQNPTGAASGGEVEDYAFSITERSGQPATVDSFLKIASGINGGPSLANGNYFGISAASLGDLDGDGVADLAVGAAVDGTGGPGRGAVYVLLMNAGGTVRSSVKIAHALNGGPTLADGDSFGSSLAPVGDLDGDGVIDLAVGASRDDTGLLPGSERGAVHILFLNSDGTVKARHKIDALNGGPALTSGDFFGSSAAALGDLDADGVPDLAVGAGGDDTGGSARGAVHVLFLHSNGSVKSLAKVATGTVGAPTLANGDGFGSSVASLGDLDGDGVADLAVGAVGDKLGAYSRGAVHVLFMNATGTVKASTKIAHNLNGGPALANFDIFGNSVASLGDLDGDGVADLAVGAGGDDTGGANRGALHLLFMNASGTVKSRGKIPNGTGGPTLADNDIFGSSVASLGDLNGDGLVDLAVGAYQDDTGGLNRGAVHVLSLGPPGPDFGDAPDTSPGTGPGNYQTLSANGGPSHLLVGGVFLGDAVDVDGGLLQNGDADADDVGGGLPDDEDGVLSSLDLLGTEGAAPTVSLLVTNTSGASATLSGWIDYNRNGVFDNATERAQAIVGSGTTDGRVTLVFPTIPAGAAGKTYARFRLSTDAAAQNSTGVAANGEVEDYVFSITARAGQPTTVDSFLKIASGTSGGPPLASNDSFGASIAPLGDLDSDGVIDLAVGAFDDDTGGGTKNSNRGAVHVLLMKANGAVKSSITIAHNTGGGPTLADGDRFGVSVAPLGDLDGDGVADLAVGAEGDKTGGANRGAVYVFLMNANGTAKNIAKIASGIGGAPTLANGDRFGSSVASLGDLDGDGVADLAVGAITDNTGGNFRGAVHVLFMNADGTVKSSVKIASNTGGGPTLADDDLFGFSVASLGDLDGDGVADMAVGANGDDTGGFSAGAVHVLFMKPDGTAKSTFKIASGIGGGPTLTNFTYFGDSVASVGDLDGDGVGDLAVGARNDQLIGGGTRGSVHVLLLNANGTVKTSAKIAHNTSGGPPLVLNDFFGGSVASLGDLNGDGVVDLAVGAEGDDTGGDSRGAVHVLFLRGVASPGDYDGDADADGSDFLLWQRTLGAPAVPPGSGADGNSSGVIDAGDLAVWKTNFGNVGSITTATPATAAANSAALRAAALDAVYAAGDFTGALDDREAFRPIRRARLRFATLR